MFKKFFPLMALLAMTWIACEKDESLKLNENRDLISTSADSPTSDAKSLQLGRNCGMQSHMDKLMQDESYRQEHLEKLEKVNSMANNRAACSNPVVVPIAVHFQGVSNPDITCLRQLAATQVATLNADYQGTNSDIGLWTGNAASSFPGISNGSTCVTFCLASKNHPSGYNLNDGDPAVTVNQTSGDSDGNWSGYINIFVQSNTGVLGYSPLGGSGNGDGVVIDANAFGSGGGCPGVNPNAPYNLGRTLTHELGHYLLLDHIWGGNGGCNNDDNVTDTPVSANPYYGCPQIGASSCSSTDLHMDYMDYTDDACMYMFTTGQANRMDNYVLSSLSHVVANAANVCGNTPPPPPPGTCDAPGNLSVSGISQSGASFSWTAVSGATQYQIALRTVGGNWAQNTVSTNSYTASNLQSCTDYQARVRAVCGSTNSAWTALTSFSTTGCTNGCTVDPIDPYTGQTLTDQDCIQLVVDNDPYCCNVGWDGICQDAYDECSGGSGSSCVVDPVHPNSGQPLSDADCIEEVQIDDPYCCEIDWDGICQDAYDDCVYGLLKPVGSSENVVNVHPQSERNSNQIWIAYSIPEAQQTLRVRLMDLKGKVLFDQALSSRRGIVRIDVGHLNMRNGVYNIILDDQQNTKVVKKWAALAPSRK